MGRAKLVVTMLLLGLAGLALALGEGGGVRAQATPVALPTLTPASPSVPDKTMAENSVDTEPDSSAYVVKAGDTLLTVAIETGVDLDDAPCLVSPDFHVGQPLIVGIELEMLPTDVACHTVANGETLAGIAARYRSSPAEIRTLPWNQWPSELSDIVVLPPGSHLRVPRGPEPEVSITINLSDEDAFLPMMLRQPVDSSPFNIRAISAAMSTEGALPVGGPRVVNGALQMAPVPVDWPYGTGSFAWPLYGWLSQDFDFDHRAIDVAAPAGTLVTAADRGVVTRAGWNSQGYGNFVVIDHNIDYVTLYGHLSEVLVSEGEVVAQGQPIGVVGSTGNSTGPHLHFEIRDFGRRTDPIELLVR